MSQELLNVAVRAARLAWPDREALVRAAEAARYPDPHAMAEFLATFSPKVVMELINQLNARRATERLSPEARRLIMLLGSASRLVENAGLAALAADDLTRQRRLGEMTQEVGVLCNNISDIMSPKQEGVRTSE